jgi:hypothetical protein
MREDRPVDGLGDEVGGADLERALDRLDILEARHHDHRHPAAAGQPAQLGARRETVHHWHADVHQHEIWSMRMLASSACCPSWASTTSNPARVRSRA